MDYLVAVQDVMINTKIKYPESDGQPMADNTKQFRWIMTLQGGIDSLFASDPNVFVAGDLLWYPVQGDNKTRVAPDVMVAFGRPKGDRGSYLQWQEGGIAPQVVFEVLSPGNTRAEMTRKLEFYDHYGVEEYYVYDPDQVTLKGWMRLRGKLHKINFLAGGWISPRLGIRLELKDELEVYYPDGRKFVTFVELDQQRNQAESRRNQAEYEREQAESRRNQAEFEREQAESKCNQAEYERNQAQLEREKAEHALAQAQQEQALAQIRLAQMAAKLRALGIDPDS